MMKKLQLIQSAFFSAAVIFVSACKDAKIPYAQNDKLEVPQLSDVK